MTIWKTFDEFTCMLNTQKFDIMTLSKTWLKDNPDLLDYVKIDGYEVKFRNKEHTRGVGVGLYIRPDIKYKLGQVGWTSFMTFILRMLQMEQLNCYLRRYEF